jgi:hypothetical protein
VHVQGQLSFFTHNSDDLGSERNVIDEMAIHDVAMDPIRTGALDPMDFVSQMRKIGCQDRWGHNDILHEAID